MTNWPPSFPCPLISGYGTEAYAGVIRTPFQAGNTRQRRVNRLLPHSISLSWVFKQHDYGLFMEWANEKGWDWFSMKLPGALAGLKGVPMFAHTVRFISDLQAEPIYAADGFHWRVSVTAEWIAGDSDFGATGPAFLSHNWIIAGRAASPSTPDWIIAGSAAAPSNANTITAGTAQTPAAIA